MCIFGDCKSFQYHSLLVVIWRNGSWNNISQNIAFIVVVILNSKCINRSSKANSRSPAYSQALDKSDPVDIKVYQQCISFSKKYDCLITYCVLN